MKDRLLVLALALAVYALPLYLAYHFFITRTFGRAALALQTII